VVRFDSITRRAIASTFWITEKERSMIDWGRAVLDILIIAYGPALFLLVLVGLVKALTKEKQ